MANFDEAYKRTNGFEGGYVNDKSDLGGETYKGVARKIHKNWAGWAIVDSYKGKSGFPGVLDKDGNVIYIF